MGQEGLSGKCPRCHRPLPIECQHCAPEQAQMTLTAEGRLFPELVSLMGLRLLADQQMRPDAAGMGAQMGSAAGDRSQGNHPAEAHPILAAGQGLQDRHQMGQQLLEKQRGQLQLRLQQPQPLFHAQP